MAASDVIVIGIGPQSSIPELILFGLSPNPGGEPNPPSTGDTVLATSGNSALTGGGDDLEMG